MADCFLGWLLRSAACFAALVPVAEEEERISCTYSQLAQKKLGHHPFVTVIAKWAVFNDMHSMIVCLILTIKQYSSLKYSKKTWWPSFFWWLAALLTHCTPRPSDARRTASCLFAPRAPVRPAVRRPRHLPCPSLVYGLHTASTSQLVVLLVLQFGRSCCCMVAEDTGGVSAKKQVEGQPFFSRFYFWRGFLIY